MDKIAPLEPPYAPEVDTWLRKWMPPGAAVEPLALFRTLAKSPLLAERMRPLGAGLLGKGTLEARDRETVILRTCARCGAEYEWGVHVTAYARALLSDEEIRATRDGGADLLLRAVDELHDRGTLTPGTLAELGARYSEEQILEILALCGFYHLISFIANGARVPLEPWAERFTMGA
jgi:4-carboxymuconolactone decarboxylase